MTRVEQIVKCLHSDHVYIQTHNFPDPDAIACAYGMRRLLKKHGIRGTICHQGRIDTYSTNRLVEELGITIHDYDEVRSQMDENTEIILVDSQYGNTNIADFVGKEVVCIDHHPVFGKACDYAYCDIRPEYGACATMIAEYFLEEGVEFDRKVSTLLTYGIRTDTDGLRRGTCKADIEMLAKLFDTADYELIGELEHAMVYREDLKSYGKAIKNTEIYQNISFTDVGKNCPPTLVSLICDFMLSLVEVEMAVCYSGNREGIKLSVRSENNRLNAGVIINRALKDIGGGGGHQSMAGGFVPYTGNAANDRELPEIIREKFIDVIHGSGAFKKTAVADDD